MADAWDPAQYERFKEERTRPFRDLVAMVRARPGMRVADLGCGTGETTRELHRALGARETIGVDSSDAMLAKAAAFAGDGLRFEKGDIATWRGVEGGLDLVFSNAALQWVPDNEGVLARLRDALSPGGQIAVQVPANEDHPSHVTAAEVAAEAPFSLAPRVSSILPPERYAARLHELGFVEQEVLLRVYPQLLPSREDVVEWVKGTLLTDYRKRLPPAQWEPFLAAYRARLMPRLADQRPFFYPYKRILFRARRP